MPEQTRLDDRAATILAEAVRCPTVARPAGDAQAAVAFGDLHAVLARRFPLLWEAAERESVGEHGLLMRLAGRGGGDPLVFMAHQDVVPALPGDGWSRDPYSGEIVDGRVYGRGTLDDKGDLVAKLLAVETLLEEGTRPEADLWLVLGDNEETSGQTAVEAARTLKERGVAPRLVMDEGGVVATQAFPGVERAQGLLGLGEKGLMSVRLSVSTTGGHASFPPKVTAVDRLALALVRLRRRPFPSRLTPVTSRLLAHLGTRATGAFAPALKAAASAGPVGAALLSKMGGEAAAMVHTTVAGTRLEGSEANNVLAAKASAVLNLRLAPWDSVDSALARLRRTVRDKTIEFEVLDASEPSPVSDPDAPELGLVAQALAVSHPDADLAPYITIAATDARHFHSVSPNVYRFSPIEVDREERSRIHGVDESVRVAALGPAVVFYRELLARF